MVWHDGCGMVEPEVRGVAWWMGSSMLGCVACTDDPLLLLGCMLQVLAH